MKYIRTKDEIYEIIGGIVHTIFPPEYRNRHKSKLAVIDEVIKQADTIEELCDVFVKKSKENKNDFFEISKDYLKIFDRKYHKEDLEHYDYYGAIWTDKGLIYVTKMNNKGELELI